VDRAGPLPPTRPACAFAAPSLVGLSCPRRRCGARADVRGQRSERSGPLPSVIGDLRVSSRRSSPSPSLPPLLVRVLRE
uniref:Uncharacterized protein n=1 Tax=Plectus sambesii TaxID=2011161 RepID=A0A914VFS8_9BILA